MTLSRNEEMIFRELQAIAGDAKQVADNITRDHEERGKQAEAIPKERGRVCLPGVGLPGQPMRGFDRVDLAKDLCFIHSRLSLLIDYVRGDDH